MKLKSARAQFKAAGDTAAGTGEFEALVSVYNYVDSWGDVVRYGAFADTIADWAASLSAIPVLWSHRMDDPTYNIGAVDEIAELEGGDARIPEWVDPFAKTNGGLWVRARIDTGSDATPIAVQALRLLKSRRVTQFSYAYDEVDSGPVVVDGQDAWELRKLKLYEVSPTQVGVNDMTELLAAKAAGVNVPTLRAALAVYGTALIDGDATGNGLANPDEEPARVKSGTEPARHKGASLCLLTDLKEKEIFC